MECVLEQQAMDGNFSNKIFFSYEAHFTLVEYANKQNCRIWGSSRKSHYLVRSQGAIGPYSFENDDGTTVTVNSASYGHLIIDILAGTQEYNLENMWFQQDCGTVEGIWLYYKRHFFAA